MSLYNRALSSNEIQLFIWPAVRASALPPQHRPSLLNRPTRRWWWARRRHFSVSASGTQPLSYQWTFDTTNIAAGTNATLVLNNVQLTNAGIYAVVVSNLVGSVLSSNATLTVLAPACDHHPTHQPDGLCWRHGQFQCHRLRHVAVELSMELQSDQYRQCDQRHVGADQRPAQSSRHLYGAGGQSGQFHP